jgi:phosphoribosyl 1,2-cyclic phosphodiesterase
VRFASLGSGSRGNATVVQCGKTTVLVDCGFSLTQTERRLERLAVDPAMLSAVLVTHEHSDHIAGVARLSRKYGLPVYLTHGTWSSGRCEGAAEYEFVSSEASFGLGELEITPLAVPHDAREPCQFMFRGEGATLGVLTDLGAITPFISQRFAACQGLLLEFNHDLELLHNGPYPEALKRRVGGEWGHLNNKQAAEFLAGAVGCGLQQLVVAHISDKNNARECVEAAMKAAGCWREDLVWAGQEQGFDWLCLV